MPTPFLCDNCEWPGTSFQESGKGVTITPNADERVRFFHLDGQAFRIRYGLQRQGACDLLVEYCRGTGSPVDLFTGLKGSGFDRAAQQIASAFMALKADLCELQEGAKFRALIVGSASSPPNQKQLVKRLMRKGMDEVSFKTGVKRGGMVSLRQYVA